MGTHFFEDNQPKLFLPVPEKTISLIFIFLPSSIVKTTLFLCLESSPIFFIEALISARKYPSSLYSFLILFVELFKKLGFILIPTLYDKTSFTFLSLIFLLPMISIFAKTGDSVTLIVMEIPSEDSLLNSIWTSLNTPKSHNRFTALLKSSAVTV